MTEQGPAHSTLLASLGLCADEAFGGLTPPLFASDTYRWADPDAKPRYDYSRTVNPNRDLLIRLLGELEGAAGGVATNSGQAAALLALLQLPAGALVVAPHDCYGGTYRLISALEQQGKLRARFIDQGDDAAYAAALADQPALVWFETPSNPLLRIIDLAERSRQAHAAGALTLADNTLPTPLRQRPLELGCDFVLHSTTKGLNGHADLFGGALLAAEPGRVEQLEWWANSSGLSASAHDAWMTLRGLRTLSLRIDRQEATARQIAVWLAAHPAVLEVNYPGLDGSPHRRLAELQQSGPGFLLSFRVAGGEQVANRFLKGLRLVTLASSLGGFSTLICKPATMTHRGMPPEAQREAGILPDLLRLSVGLEDAADLRGDLQRAFSEVGEPND